MENTIKLKAITKSYIWGGNRLFDYGKTSKEDIIAESWELSFHPDGMCIIDSGIDKEKPLSEVIDEKQLGINAKAFSFFPILIKLIDARDNLSIQVHPSDEYALKNENSLGKSEMWYVVEADDDACLYIGLNKSVTKEDFVDYIKKNSLLEIMNKIPVKAGDCYYIPSGTLHAIGKGCFICEVQENSNLTYRVFDYGRIGKNGKPRELHIEKALKVCNFTKMVPENLKKKNPLVENQYFKVSHLRNIKKIPANPKSFTSIIVLLGEGKINNIDVKKGDSIFVSCNQEINIEGELDIIHTVI